ncbi:hypothetical protein LINGRAHAP2_LOCUS13362, partial [Linum grandiflorum]
MQRNDVPSTSGATGWVLGDSTGAVLYVDSLYSSVFIPYYLNYWQFVNRDASMSCCWVGLLQVDIEGDATKATTHVW